LNRLDRKKSSLLQNNKQREGVKIMYKIIRFYSDSDDDRNGEIIATGLTLEEAQAHCKREDTHEVGVWFDGYTQE
jgi:hypothetical protein